MITFFSSRSERKPNPIVWGMALVLFCSGFAQGQSVEWPDSSQPVLPPGLDAATFEGRAVADQRVRRLIIPQRIVWKSDTGIENEERLLEKPLGQTSTANMDDGFTMSKSTGKPCAVLLDFGAEIHGGIRLEARNLCPTAQSVGRTVRVRVRFGESADEAMAEMGEKGAVNDHSIRDMVISVPWLGSVEFGESAFRFVRLDLIDDGAKMVFDSARAVFTYRDLPWVGHFSCSDDRLNTIWRTAAHTQHLTMQNYMFEGAKRDRLVWLGDCNPQTMTTLYVFGAPKVLKDSLSMLARTQWPLPKWMNGMPNYSLWWIISVSEIYRYSGDLDFLRQQQEYLTGLVHQLEPCINQETGRAGFSSPFLDWPTAENRPALDAGTHALFAVALDAAAEMAVALGDSALQHKTETLAKKVRQFVPDHVHNKQAAALMYLAGLSDSTQPALDVVAQNGPDGFSTFYGYYMLEALAKGNQKQLGMDIVRQFWGGMIDRGATTFWEDFALDWCDGAGRIDEITPPGLQSLHADRGAFCYIGLRHSLCHGWASGPAAWLSAHVLGVVPTSPGFQTVRIEPFLGDLEWVEGTVPTPHGPIFVRAEKDSDGKVQVTARLPHGVQQVK